MERGKLQVSRTQSYPQDGSRSPIIEKYSYEEAFSAQGPTSQLTCSQFKALVSPKSQGDMKTTSGSSVPDKNININDHTTSNMTGYSQSLNENDFLGEERTKSVKNNEKKTDQISRVDRIPDLSARKSQSSRESHITIEMSSIGRQRSTSNQSQFQTPATVICNCENSLTCRRFCGFISKICKAKPSERQEISKKLSDFLTQDQVSLAEKFCPFSGTKPKTVLMTILEEIPNGCDIIKDQLNNLKELNEEVIKIKIGTGKLFQGKENQSKILKDLLSVRNRAKKGPSHEALTSLIKHPVIVIFILEKWKHAKFLFIMHLRYATV